MFHYKHTNENPKESHSLGFSMPFGYGGLNHRLVTDYLFLSNHLQMRWLITPAAMETIRDNNISIMDALLPVTSVRGGNIGIITYECGLYYCFIATSQKVAVTRAAAGDAWITSFYIFLCRHKVVTSQPAVITPTAGRYPDHLLLFVFSSLFYDLIYISR